MACFEEALRQKTGITGIMTNSEHIINKNRFTYDNLTKGIK